MSNKKFTRQDKDTVFAFFDRSWKIYANNNPMLAIIPDNPATGDFEYWTNLLLTKPYYRDDIKHAYRKKKKKIYQIYSSLFYRKRIRVSNRYNGS